MVLVDTTVWVVHLRRGEPELRDLLNKGEVVCHTFVIGELACGHLRSREQILSLLKALPIATLVESDEILFFIEERKLAGLGLGLIDIHLLASCLISRVKLWTLDKKLGGVAAKLVVAHG
jgi:hypothetical protein